MWWMWARALATPLVVDTSAVAVVDVDGDGVLDVVLGAGPGVHYGVAGATPGPVMPLVRDPVAESAQFVDLDSDGVPEVCTATFEALTCRQGLGRSLGAVLHTEPTRVLAMHVVDFEGDGDDDLLVSTLAGLELRRSDGAGGLTVEPPLVGDTLQVFVEADIDGDGDLDLSASRTTLGEAYWLERDAAGALRPPAPLIDGGMNAFHVGFLDATGDGLPDLLQQSYSFPIYLRARQAKGVVRDPDTSDTGLWKTTGEEGYGPSVSLPYHAGFSVAVLGGGPGLLVAEDGAVLWDEGATGAAVSVATLHPTSHRLVATRPADLDGDGTTDVVVVDRDLRMVRDPLGAGDEVTLQRGVEQLGAFAAGDVDGDGRLDVVYGDAVTGEVFTLGGAGAGAFHAGTTWLPSGPPVVDLALMDLDRDGQIDLLVLEQGLELVVHPGSGAAPLRMAGVSQLGLTLDGDGDGDDEQLVALAGGGLRWLDDDGAGGLAPGPEVATDAVRALAAGDTDGDGVAEVVALTDAHVVRYRTGAAGWAEVERVEAPGDEPFAVYTTDPDGDGRDTVLVHAACELGYVYDSPNYPYCRTQELLYALDEVGGLWSAPTDYGEATAPVLSVDYDGDGADELITGAYGTLLFWFDGTVDPDLIGYGGPLLQAVDLDGDGDLDLLSGNDEGLSALWNGDGPPLPVDTADTGDTGSVEPSDATGDTGASLPATTPPLSTAPDDTASATSKGCGCQAPGGATGSLWWAGLLGVWGARRRPGRPPMG